MEWERISFEFLTFHEFTLKIRVEIDATIATSFFFFLPVWLGQKVSDEV